jgi:hypothetical protein
MPEGICPSLQEYILICRYCKHMGKIKCSYLVLRRDDVYNMGIASISVSNSTSQYGSLTSCPNFGKFISFVEHLKDY